MADLFKYGVAFHIYKPIIKRAVVDFAVGADWTPAAGDVKISKDGGAAANVTNLPTAITMGNTAMWDYSITATEAQAAKVLITVADSATKAVEDTMFEIHTYGHASAQHQVDFADSVRAGLTALPNAAAEASGGLATLSAAQASNGTINANVHRWLTGTPNALTSGRVEVLVGAVTNGVIAAASFAANALDAVWSTATRLLTAGTNIVLAKGVGVTGFTDLDAAAVRTAIGLASANLDAQLAAIAGYIDTEVGTIITAVNAIKAKTDNLPAAPAAVGDIPSAATITSVVLTTAMTESYAADGVAPTLAQAMFQLIGRNYEFAIAGDTLTVKKLDGSTTAMTFTLAPAGGPYTSITRAT